MSAPRSVARRTACICAAALLALPGAVLAQAAWPAAPIKLIVPFAPGGSNDVIARVLADKLGARLGQTVVVENKGGAGGTIGTDFVAKAPADGYTLLFASTSITTNAASGKKLPYDPVKDLQPIGLVAAGPFAVVVGNDSKMTTLREFIDAARAKPGTISYGTAGVGGLNHLGTEMLAAAAKIDLVHVPYKGIGPAFNDLLGGTLQMLLPSVASVAPHIKGGKMRGLAVTSAQRSPTLPDLPTVSEAGLPGFELEVWWGLLAPARTPPAVVKRLNDELNAVLTQTELRETLAREGALPKPGTPDKFGQLISTELTRWTNLIRDQKIQLD